MSSCWIQAPTASSPPGCRTLQNSGVIASGPCLFQSNLEITGRQINAHSVRLACQRFYGLEEYIAVIRPDIHEFPTTRLASLCPGRYASQMDQAPGEISPVLRSWLSRRVKYARPTCKPGSPSGRIFYPSRISGWSRYSCSRVNSLPICSPSIRAW